MKTFWKDKISGSIIVMHTDFDAKEMAKHADYDKTTEKEWTEQQKHYKLLESDIPVNA